MLTEQVEEPRQQDTGWLTALDFLWLEITPKCNLHCVHCYAESSPLKPLTQGMTGADWLRVLDEGYSLGCRAIQFIGGEPTLHPQLPLFIERGKTLGYSYLEVFTNGTTLDTPYGHKLLKTFRDNGVNLAFSAYSDQSGAHDSVTKINGSFERTIRGIKSAVEFGITTRVGVIDISQDPEGVERTKTMLLGMGVSSVSTDRLRGVGRGQELAFNRDLFGELCGSCWRGKLCVKPDGKVSPCVFSWFNPVGDVTEGLPAVLNDHKLQDFRKKVRQQDERERRLVCPPNCSPPCPPDCYPSCSPCTPDCGPGQCGPDAP
ncbi:MAG: radical SAM protein [Patescibacteria group bacterium]